MAPEVQLVEERRFLYYVVASKAFANLISTFTEAIQCLKHSVYSMHSITPGGNYIMTLKLGQAI
jgi:hypothetical protein